MECREHHNRRQPKAAGSGATRGLTRNKEGASGQRNKTKTVGAALGEKLTNWTVGSLSYGSLGETGDRPRRHREVFGSSPYATKSEGSKNENLT